MVSNASLIFILTSFAILCNSRHLYKLSFSSRGFVKLQKQYKLIARDLSGDKMKGKMKRVGGFGREGGGLGGDTAIPIAMTGLLYRGTIFDNDVLRFQHHGQVLVIKIKEIKALMDKRGDLMGKKVADFNKIASYKKYPLKGSLAKL